MSVTMLEGAIALAERITGEPTGMYSVGALRPEVRVTIALLLAALLEARGEWPPATSEST